MPTILGLKEAEAEGSETQDHPTRESSEASLEQKIKHAKYKAAGYLLSAASVVSRRKNIWKFSRLTLFGIERERAALLPLCD